MAKKIRRPAPAPNLDTVKVSVPLDVETHAKLAAYAALRRVPMSSVIASAVRDVVGSMVVFDRSVKATRADSPTSVSSIDGEAA